MTGLSSLTVGGVPTMGVNGLPVPFTGNYFFCKPGTGAGGADGNDGKTVGTAVATVAHALSLCTAGNNDVVFLIASSNTAANTTDYQSATLDWNKDGTHLVGINAGSRWSMRSRIAQLSTATGVSPLVKVSANNCYIANIEIFQGVADATSLIAVEVTGQRNVFANCCIQGMGNATQVTAGGMSLKLTAASENLFSNCLIGTDTIARDQNVTEMDVITGSTRNYFRNCIFDSYLSNAGFAAVTIGTNGIDRELVFDNCQFWAKSSNKSITQTAVFSIPAISQGAIVLFNSTFFTDGGTGGVWDANARGIIFNNTVAAAASGAGGEMTNL
jgi:hypothetical protein